METRRMAVVRREYEIVRATVGTAFLDRSHGWMVVLRCGTVTNAEGEQRPLVIYRPVMYPLDGELMAGTYTDLLPLFNASPVPPLNVRRAIHRQYHVHNVWNLPPCMMCPP
jgi:hypothetical protein